MRRYFPAHILRFALLVIASSLLIIPQGTADAQRRNSRKRSATKSKSSPVSSVSQIKALSAILVDAATGQVLYEKNADVKRPPASTTKIMTSILLLENLTPDEVITASKAAEETEGSSLHLKAGEQISARDMLYALMLRSANDGCVAVAERVAGSEPAFAEMMTRRAHEIGATNTQFLNCNGLNCDGHVTTARDLATMARYASRYPEFNAATRTKVRQIKRSSPSKDTVLKNHAKFLWRFPGADGIKTGWTVPAGRCFVGGATWNGWRLISVVMHSPDLPGETSVLMKYGFQKFERVRGADAGTSFGAAPVEDGTSLTVPAVTKSAIYVVKPRGVQTKIELRTKLDAVRAPITAGMHVGEVEVYSDGLLASKAELVASSAVGKSVAALRRRGGPPLYYGFAALVGVIGLGYGSSFAKAARIRRRRLKAIMRGADHRW